MNGKTAPNFIILIRVVPIEPNTATLTGRQTDVRRQFRGRRNVFIKDCSFNCVCDRVSTSDLMEIFVILM
jgi:hypothetical protein